MDRKHAIKSTKNKSIIANLNLDIIVFHRCATQCMKTCLFFFDPLAKLSEWLISPTMYKTRVEDSVRLLLTNNIVNPSYPTWSGITPWTCQPWVVIPHSPKNHQNTQALPWQQRGDTVGRGGHSRQAWKHALKFKKDTQILCVQWCGFHKSNITYEDSLP